MRDPYLRAGRRLTQRDANTVHIEIRFWRTGLLCRIGGWVIDCWPAPATRGLLTVLCVGVWRPNPDPLFNPSYHLSPSVVVACFFFF